MKNKLWVILMALPIVLSSCTAMDEDEQEVMITKEAPMRWSPWPCTINDEFGIPIAVGAKCKFFHAGGCKWPTRCKEKHYDFIQLALENTPGLTMENWASEPVPLLAYDVHLALWLENPVDFYHPDSIPPDTIQ